MRFKVYVGLLMCCLCFAIQPALAGQSGLRQKPKKILVKSRIVARVPLETFSSVGLNYESYIFEIDLGGKGSTPQLVKASYRFHLRDAQLPADFFDYALVHRFRVRRDDSCDEAWNSLANRYRFDRNGNFRGSENALVYSSNAPVPQVEGDASLPCYVVTPEDYQSTEKRTKEKQLAEKRSPDKMVSAR